MIKRLTSGEYLKRVTCMTPSERAEYTERVDTWLQHQAPLLLARMNWQAAAFQDAVQCSAMWNDAECKAWEEGARLLTALMGTVDTWLPDMLYIKSAKRAIRRMNECLVVIKSGEEKVKNEEPATPAEPKTDTTKSRGWIKKDVPEPPTVGVPQGSSPVRPKHIDQYVHLLPVQTQQRAAEVKGLLADMDAARENMRLLAEDKHASPDDRAKWAAKATKIDARLHIIYKELDSEWQKLVESGRVTVDDLGQAHVAETGTSSETGEIDEAPSRPELTTEEKAKLKVLRGFLKDTRRGNGRTREEHVRKWKATYREMIQLAGPDSVTDKVRDAAQHYGVDIETIIINN